MSLASSGDGKHTVTETHGPDRDVVASDRLVELALQLLLELTSDDLGELNTADLCPVYLHEQTLALDGGTCSEIDWRMQQRRLSHTMDEELAFAHLNAQVCEVRHPERRLKRRLASRPNIQVPREGGLIDLKIKVLRRSA
jgi:hypothetical protein